VIVTAPDKVIDCGVQPKDRWTLRAYQEAGGEDELRYTFRDVDDDFLRRTLKEAIENGENGENGEHPSV
jgi:hypothetical protein